MWISRVARYVLTGVILTGDQVIAFQVTPQVAAADAAETRSASGIGQGGGTTSKCNEGDYNTRDR